MPPTLLSIYFDGDDDDDDATKDISMQIYEVTN